MALISVWRASKCPRSYRSAGNHATGRQLTNYFSRYAPYSAAAALLQYLRKLWGSIDPVSGRTMWNTHMFFAFLCCCPSCQSTFFEEQRAKGPSSCCGIAHCNLLAFKHLLLAQSTVLTGKKVDVGIYYSAELLLNISTSLALRFSGQYNHLHSSPPHLPHFHRHINYHFPSTQYPQPG